MGTSTAITGSLPPLPPGAKLNAPPTGSASLPPLPEGATLNQSPSGGGGGLGAWTAKNLKGEGGPEDWESPELGGMASGFVKSAAQPAATILDLLSKPLTKPGATEPGSIAAHGAAHMQDAANWLRTGGEAEGVWENIGAAGEQVLEYIGTDGLLKLAGPAAKGTETGARIVDAAKNLKGAQQVAEFLSAHPKIAGLVGIGLKASKDALTMGGQGYAHTEDPHQAAVAAALGAGANVAGEAVELGAARWLAKKGPKTIKVGPFEAPALNRQVNEKGFAVPGRADEAPEIQQAQEQLFHNVVGHTAREATATALDRINEMRPVYPATEEAARMLPAGEDAEPFTFTLQGTPTVEGTTGEMVQSAAKVPGRAAFKEPQYTTASAPTREPIRPGGPTAAEGQQGADIRTATTPEAAADTARGGGNLQSTSPSEAEGWLRQIEDLQQTPEYSKLSESQQNAIESQRQQLADQLKVYYSSAYTRSRFQPVNVGEAAGSVNTFGDAAAQVEGAAKPVYERLDQISNGDFNKYKEAAKQAQAVMRRTTTMDAYEDAQKRFTEANGAINDLIDSHRSQISFEDYMTAKNAWRDSSRLDEMHNLVERMLNGVTYEEGAQGMPRFIERTRTKSIQDYLNKGTNQEQIEGLIGKEGVRNLKNVTNLLSDSKTTRATQGLGREVYMELARRAGKAGAGAFAGSVIAPHFGLSPWQGAVGGAAASDGLRWILRTAAISPRIGNMLESAIRNEVSTKIAAPLIARTIAQMKGAMEPPQQEEEQPQQ